MTHTQVLAWVGGYVSAWRTSGTSQLKEVFSKDISYQVSPWKEPIHGLTELSSFWKSSREPEEIFKLQKEVVVIKGKRAVVKVYVEYQRPTSQMARLMDSRI